MFHWFRKSRPRTTADILVRRKPSIDFSMSGVLYAAITVFMGVAAMNSQANLLFGVFGLMLGVLLVSGTVCRATLRKVKVDRVLPEHAIVGKNATFTYQFTNRKRFWPSFSLTLAEMDGCEAFTKQPCGYMLHAAPGMTATVPVEVIPRRRGVYTINRYQLSSSFPFGFIKRASQKSQKDSLLVYPPLASVNPRLLSFCRSAEKMGTRMRPRRGGSDEFFGVKEFRQGENPRWIYWRRSARTGTLVAKEMTQISPPRLMLLVDTCQVATTPYAQADCERTIAMAASLASEALAAGLSVGLCTWSGDWIQISPNRGKRHRRDLLSLLAQLPQNLTHNHRMLLDYAQKLAESGTTPVLLTPSNLQPGRSEHERSGMLVLSAASPEALRWFAFDPKIDFSLCSPVVDKPQH